MVENKLETLRELLKDLPVSVHEDIKDKEFTITTDCDSVEEIREEVENYLLDSTEFIIDEDAVDNSCSWLQIIYKIKTT